MKLGPVVEHGALELGAEAADASEAGVATVGAGENALAGAKMSANRTRMWCGPSPFGMTTVRGVSIVPRHAVDRQVGVVGQLLQKCAHDDVMLVDAGCSVPCRSRERHTGTRPNAGSGAAAARPWAYPARS